MPKKFLYPLVAGILITSSFPWINQYIEQQLVYHPEPVAQNQPLPESSLPLEEIWFQSANKKKLHGWLIRKEKAKRGMLWLHGNTGNLDDCLASLTGMYEQLPYNILIFDYQGYGKSEGTPLEERLYQDAEAAWDTLATCTKNQPIIIYGHSLGVAVALELARRKNPVALILEGGFTSLYAIGKEHYPYLPHRLLAGKKYNSIAKVPLLTKIPKLFIHGKADEVVPFYQGEQLWQAAAQPKQFYPVPRGDHNNNYQLASKQYYQVIKNFLSDNQLL